MPLSSVSLVPFSFPTAQLVTTGEDCRLKDGGRRRGALAAGPPRLPRDPAPGCQGASAAHQRFWACLPLRPLCLPCPALCRPCAPLWHWLVSETALLPVLASLLGAVPSPMVPGLSLGPTPSLLQMRGRCCHQPGDPARGRAEHGDSFLGRGSSGFTQMCFICSDWEGFGHG